jgi:hypothetical protein
MGQPPHSTFSNPAGRIGAQGVAAVAAFRLSDEIPFLCYPRAVVMFLPTLG